MLSHIGMLSKKCGIIYKTVNVHRLFKLFQLRLQIFTLIKIKILAMLYFSKFSLFSFIVNLRK